MGEYTPGPWWTEGRFIVAKVPDGRPNGEVIAAFGPTAGSLRGKIPDEENARLAAAAPDLLEACKEFVRKCECGEARSVRSYAQMKAAIAKAEGEKKR